ncbi:MAG: dockerin type I repeat-containing protein [Candidatus Gribaldobacteria bacterium]|nr:dockerin type I repeat-containing protein [Candidatus Gribaldobacteria bacterium]
MKHLFFCAVIFFVIVASAGAYDMSVKDITEPVPEIFVGKDTVLAKLEFTNTKDIEEVSFQFFITMDIQSIFNSIVIKSPSFVDESGRQAISSASGAKNYCNAMAIWPGFKAGIHQITVKAKVGIIVRASREEGIVYAAAGTPISSISTQLDEVMATGSIVKEGNLPLTARIGATAAIMPLSISAFLGEKRVYPPQVSSPVKIGETFYITIPDAQGPVILKMGETLAMTVSGGVPPYVWDSTVCASSKTMSGLPSSSLSELACLEVDPNEKARLCLLSSWMMVSEEDLYFARVDIKVKDSSGLICSLSIDAFPVYGDIDGNGKVETDDVMMVANSLLTGVPLFPVQKYAADVNGDGIISAADALLISQRVAGIIVSFPVEAGIVAKAPPSGRRTTWGAIKSTL